MEESASQHEVAEVWYVSADVVLPSGRVVVAGSWVIADSFQVVVQEPLNPADFAAVIESATTLRDRRSSLRPSRGASGARRGGSQQLAGGPPRLQLVTPGRPRSATEK